MAKFFTIDGGRTYYNTEQILKMGRVNQDVPDTQILFADGSDVTTTMSIVQVLNLVRMAD